MIKMTYLLAGLFLPLFPLSMVFNALFGRIRNELLRATMLIIWPLPGVFMLTSLDVQVPSWILPLALFTSALYAYRALALREVGQWISFVATSAWALLWIPLQGEAAAARLYFYAIAFSAPLVLLVMLGAGLERRFGAAYTGLYGGLAQSIPRFAGVLVIVVLASVSTPVFPGFFTMLSTIVLTAPAIAIVITLIWLLWSWAGIRLLQGLIIGPANANPAADLSLSATWGYVVVLASLVMAGLYGIGGVA